METVYYRLKQVDFDGKFAYSNTIYLTEQTVKTAELIAFPNPSKGEIALSAKGLNEEITNFAVTNLVITNYAIIKVVNIKF